MSSVEIKDSNAIWAAIKSLMVVDFHYLDDVEDFADHYVTADGNPYDDSEAGIALGIKAAAEGSSIYKVTINESETTYYFVGEEYDIADKVRNLEDK